MLRNTSKFIFLSILLIFSSCHFIANYQIIGVWKATEIFENDKILKDKTLENIVLQFNDEGYYTYEGTLNYKEAGKFKVKRSSLFLSSQSKEEKELHIEALNSKKLVLLMEDAGKVRKMVFSKNFN
jgi:site-specific DNA-cytosine methylase